MSFIKGYEKLEGYGFHQELTWVIRNVSGGGDVIGFAVWAPRHVWIPNHNPSDERSYGIRFTPTQLSAYRDGNFVDSVAIEKRQYRDIPAFLEVLAALVRSCESSR